jgi:hypothetical protein
MTTATRCGSTLPLGALKSCNGRPVIRLVIPDRAIGGQRQSAFGHAQENGIPAHEVMIKGGPDMQGHKASDH